MAINAQEIDINNQSTEPECPGGKSAGDCATTEALIRNSQDFVPDRHLTALDEVAHYNQLAYIFVGCVACRQICTISVEMLEREPTGRFQIHPKP